MKGKEREGKGKEGKKAPPENILSIRDETISQQADTVGAMDHDKVFATSTANQHITR